MNHEKKEKEGEEDGVWNLNLHVVAMEMGDWCSEEVQSVWLYSTRVIVGTRINWEDNCF